MGATRKKWEGEGSSALLCSAPSSEISTADHTRTPQCAVSAPVASVNQLQGPHGLSLVWDRKPLAKLWYLPRLEAGSTDTDEGTGHRNLRTVGPPEKPETRNQKRRLQSVQSSVQSADPTPPLSCRQSALAVAALQVAVARWEKWRACPVGW